VRSPQRPTATASFLLLLAGPSLGQVTQRVSVNPRRIRSGEQRLYQVIYATPSSSAAAPRRARSTAPRRGW